MLIFYICWSKTIQCGERTLYIPLVEIPNSSLCPVKAYINMITLIPAEKMYAFTGQSEEFGISTKGIYNVLSPHCIVFDQQI
jgi:hypothetical protein